MSEPKKVAWTPHSIHYTKALKYMKQRQQRLIASYRTPWKKFNDAGTDGFEFNTITVIGGRPASGKTLIVDQIIREGFKINEILQMRILQYQLEMVGRTSKIREFSSLTGFSYKALCSAVGDESLITDETIAKCKSYAEKRAHLPIDIIDTPPTVEQFKAQVIAYMKHYSEQRQVEVAGGEKKVVTRYKNTIITVDHTLLLKKDKHEANKTEMLANLGEACTELKKIYPIAFILLSQLNREIDKPERNTDGKYGNYILDSDIFGSDALLQHADLVVGVNRPAKRFIKFYGPDRYIIDDDKVLVLHWLKARNGDIGMSFFKAKFERMEIEEMDTPAQDKKLKITTKNLQQMDDEDEVDNKEIDSIGELFPKDD